jgi:galactokinase/mevalonate kinase-like predicted kinase
MEVSSMADLPDGYGLGSSGAYLVGLLAALHLSNSGAARAHPVGRLAEEACTIELDVLGRRWASRTSTWRRTAG